MPSMGSELLPPERPQDSSRQLAPGDPALSLPYHNRNTQIFLRAMSYDYDYIELRAL